MLENKKKTKRVGSRKKTQKRVILTMSASEAKSVLLAGDFNDWNTHSHPFKKETKGKWKISLSLQPGSYQYRFLVDGEWKDDPNCTTFTPNPFGSVNNVLTVKQE